MHLHLLVHSMDILRDSKALGVLERYDSSLSKETFRQGKKIQSLHLIGILEL